MAKPTDMLDFKLPVTHIDPKTMKPDPNPYDVEYSKNCISGIVTEYIEHMAERKAVFEKQCLNDASASLGLRIEFKIDKEKLKQLQFASDLLDYMAENQPKRLRQIAGIMERGKGGPR